MATLRDGARKPISASVTITVFNGMRGHNAAPLMPHYEACRVHVTCTVYEVSRTVSSSNIGRQSKICYLYVHIRDAVRWQKLGSKHHSSLATVALVEECNYFCCPCPDILYPRMLPGDRAANFRIRHSRCSDHLVSRSGHPCGIVK